MVAYFEQFVNALNRPKTYLLGANILLIFFLILLSGFGVLPIPKIQDFIFFAVIFLIFALYRPGWAFLFFIGTIALENINLAPEIIGITIRPYQFIGGLATLAVLIRIIFRRVNFELPKFRMIDWAVVVFAVSGFVSVLGALNRGVSFKHSVIALSFTALYFLTRIFIQNPEDLKRVIPFFLSSSCVVTLYGIWQNIRFNQGLNNFEAMPGRPNATFAEADWLGMYLVLLIAVIYALVYYFSEVQNDGELLNSKSQTNSKFKIQNLSLLFLYILLSLSFILLILTVSRSAWLGAVAVAVAYLSIIFTQLKFNPKEWQWKKTLNIKIGILISLAIAIGAVYFFQLTTFQLWNRAGSTASGLQEITISCNNASRSECLAVPIKDKLFLNNVSELEEYCCRHIDLEDIEKETNLGRFVTVANRPDPNINVRAQIYQKSWETIKTNPILGIGWGNSGSILGRDGRGVDLNSSNIFLETWLGSGILGFLTLVFIFGYVIIRSLAMFGRGNIDETVTGLFILLTAVAILIPNLFNAGIFLGFLWVFLGITASLSASDNL